YVIEPESSDDDAGAESDGMMLSPHEMDPAKVLRTVRAMDGRCRRIVLVGCEPADFGDEWEGRMGLTEVVKTAVETAAAMADGLLDKLLKQIEEKKVEVSDGDGDPVAALQPQPSLMEERGGMTC
ncbi:MAG: hypothetical protein ACREP1_05890, partial [Rhodanobacteraceae bacterium]